MSSVASAPVADAALNPEQRRLLVFLSGATFFEGYDFMAITQVLPQIQAEWGLSNFETTAVVSAANIGPILAFGLVRLADRWGRRKVLAFTLLAYALCSILSGLAPNAASFAFFQLLARMFLIAEWATSMVYAAECFPAARRGRAIGLIQAAATLGAISCAAITPLLNQAPWGWRTVYFVGGLPVLLLVVARRNLPETPRFLEMVKVPKAAFLRILGPGTRRKVLLLALLWALVYFGTHNASTFWKEFVVHERGFSDADVGRSTTIAALFAMPLVFGVGRLMDKLGRRKGSAILFPAAAAGVFGAYTLHSHAALTFSLIFVIFGAAGVLPVLEAYTAELFPTELRGDAFAWANNLLGRIANVVGPLGVGWAAGIYGWGPSVALTGVFTLAALVLILAAFPETAARELEETSA